MTYTMINGAKCKFLLLGPNVFRIWHKQNYTYFILIFKVFLKKEILHLLSCTDKHFVFDLTLSIIWTFL